MMQSGNYMKTVAPTGKNGYKQGYYKLINKDKYLKPSECIIYRSSYELKFCIFCDTEDKVLKWQSEPICVKYYDPVQCKTRTYYPDYIVVMKSPDGINKIIVEVKPMTFITKPEYPKKPTNKSIKNYNFRLSIFITNMAKYLATKKYAEERGMRYLFLTDSFFNKYKI